MNFLVKIAWAKKAEEVFTDKKYSRAHRWYFDGGTEVAGSSSPHVVPLPYSDASAVDPEEALVAAASSCHMLVFLYLAAIQKFVVTSYEDQAEGVMAKNAKGKMAITTIYLNPKVVFEGDNQPTPDQIAELHHLAHEDCFIASSLNSEIITRL